MVTEHCPEAGHSSGLLLSAPCIPADGIPPSSQHPARWLTGGPLHSTSKFPTSTGVVHKSVTFSCVFMLVQLNKCVVVCGSDLQRGNSGDCCLSILFKY